jgi:hypothetical protein
LVTLLLLFGGTLGSSESAMLSGFCSRNRIASSMLVNAGKLLSSEVNCDIPESQDVDL